MGIFTKLAQVFDVAVQCLRLSVAGTISVVGQNPAQRHVVLFISVNDGACRELIAARLFAVERLAYAAVVLLAFLVTLAVLEEDAVFALFPVVAVVGVEMSFVETEQRQQYGPACQLIVLVEQRHRSVGHPEEQVQVVRLVLQCNDVAGFCSEIVLARFERVEHHAIAGSGPVERCR